MFTVSEEEKESLCSGFVLMVKNPAVFPEEHMLAEIWLSDHRNTDILKPYTVEQILAQEVIPHRIYQLLKEYHDDYVEQMPERVIEQYRLRQLRLAGNIELGYN